MGEMKTLTTPWQREGRGWVSLFFGCAEEEEEEEA